MLNIHITNAEVGNNGQVVFPENYENTDIILDNVSKVCVGYRVIYVEYEDAGEFHIRAYGRKEFKNIILFDTETQDIVVEPLRGDLFHRFGVVIHVAEKVEPAAVTEDDAEDTEEVAEEN